MSLQVEISVGELVDKLTILEIKLQRISQPAKLENIKREYETLTTSLAASPFADLVPGETRAALKQVNEELWEIEDAIRLKEAASDFDKDFIALARAVYQTNDKRAALKRNINEGVGSRLVEEKSYADHR